MDHLGTTLILWLLGIPCAYVVGCLLLEEKESHEGPFKQKDQYVVFEEGPGPAHTQYVAFFDYVRRLFGVYTIEKKGLQTHWVVRPDRAEYFSCPFCLSFWCAIPFTLFGGLAFALPPLDALLVQLGIAQLSYMTFGFGRNLNE